MGLSGGRGDFWEDGGTLEEQTGDVHVCDKLCLGVGFSSPLGQQYILLADGTEVGVTW